MFFMHFIKTEWFSSYVMQNIKPNFIFKSSEMQNFHLWFYWISDSNICSVLSKIISEWPEILGIWYLVGNPIKATKPKWSVQLRHFNTYSKIWLLLLHFQFIFLQVYTLNIWEWIFIQKIGLELGIGIKIQY